MTDDLLLGIGMVAIVEGLLVSFAPGRLEQALRALQAMGPDRLRSVGLFFVAAGVGLVWLARG